MSSGTRGNNYGASQDDGSNGGRGGNGGNGGKGGDSGGGAGGNAIGAFVQIGSTFTPTNVSYTLGLAESGGASPVSAGGSGISVSVHTQ